MRKIYSILLTLASTALFAQNPHWEWVSGVESSFSEPAKALATDADGNMYTYAAFTENIITEDYELLNPNGSRESYFAKLDNQGQVVWMNHITGNGSDTIWCLDADADGNTYITGTYTDDMTIGGETYPGGNGTYFAKFDTNGDMVWIKFGSFSFMYNLKVDTNGNIYAAGGLYQNTFTYDDTTLSYTNKTTFIVKLDPNGDLVWSGIMEGPQDNTEYNQVTDIEIDNTGNVFVSGIFNHDQIAFGDVELNSAFSGNYFLVKYDADGVAQWGKTSGNSTCANVPWDITLDNTGNVYLTGNYCGTITFGDTTLTATPGSRFFIAKYDTLGEFEWVKSSNNGPSNVVHSADIDDNGNLIIGGTFYQNVNFGNGVALTSETGAQYVAFYNAEGLAQWAVATSEIDVNNTVSVKAMGNNVIYTAGHMQIPSLTFGDITYDRTGNNLYNIWLGKLVYEDIVGTQEFSKSGITVYPNPVNDILTVDSNDQVLNIAITDCNGRIVATASNSAVITTSQLSKGIYFAAVTTEAGKSTYKIVKN